MVILVFIFATIVVSLTALNWDTDAIAAIDNPDWARRRD